ncbi:MAG: efflux RND transporter periplasmic adaptor subunit, partial [Leptospira sp.]|nr:efflux RND transporter periplasmic adaptor subunit [Leptospira sp.]
KAYIYGYLFENDINYVKRGQQVIFRTESFPDLSFPGKIHGVDSILDEKNRTLRFRSYVTDKKGVLKPQMFGTMEILIPLKRVLSIPKSAIMNTGVHKVAYVRRNSDHFSPVMVRTGIETTEFYEVLQGLAEGDEVVIEANFLLDSETKIKLGGSSSEHSH